MLNLNSIMIGSKNPSVLAEFYTKVFGKPADMSEGDWRGWSVGNAYFSVGMHENVKEKSEDPGRIMFNFETKEVKEQFERIVSLGGIAVKEPYEMGNGLIGTLADPDGNYFQLMTPWS